MRHSVAGLLKAGPGSTALFAPFPASYDRLTPDSHAPTSLGWGYDNRTVALRIPQGPPQARRIEHRIAGGDANPYLLLAALLGAMLKGIEDGEDPPKAITGSAYAQDLPQIPSDFSNALELFETDPTLGFLPDLLRANLTRTKRQETSLLAEMSFEATQALLWERL